MRSALVIGASSGIGRELVNALSSRGITVIAASRRTDGVAAPAGGAPVEAVALDVTDRAAVRALAERLQKAGRTPDAVWINAGVGEREDGRTIDGDLYRHTFEVNVFGVIYAVEAFLPAFAARGSGTFAVTSSLAAWRGRPKAAAYGASKAAVDHLFEAWRTEHVRDGLRFSVLRPGPVATPLLRMNRLPPDTWTAAATAQHAVERVLAGDDEVFFSLRWTLLARLAGLVPSWWHRRMFALPAPKGR